MAHTAPAIRPPRPSAADLELAAAEFAQVRPRLRAIARRIVGSWTDAEDVVQETWLRWQVYDRTRVANPTAFLVTTTTRLAINVTNSARARHEHPVGQWLVEPIGTDDPATDVEQADALAEGMAVLFERLSPMERAAYVLRQAFGYPYNRIAEILHLTAANARQLVSRAGRRIGADRAQLVAAW